MQIRSKLYLLLPVVLACSGTDITSTDVKPQFAVMCSPPRATIPNLVAVTRAKNSDFTANFTVKNNCGVKLTLTLTASRTGAITRINARSPQSMILPSGTSQAASVSYHTGSPGTGTVVLTATTSRGVPSWGSQTVTVTN